MDSTLHLMSSLVNDLRLKEADIRLKDADLRRKDAQLEVLNAELRSSAALAAEARYRNLARLRLAGVVELRAALGVCLQSLSLHGGSAAVFAELLSTAPLGGAALQCCNLSAKVVSDNHEQPHSVQTLAAELARIMRRLNKDAHPKKSPSHYRDKGDRLLLARDGLSDSDVIISSCVLKAFGYPVEIVDAQLADPPAAAAVEQPRSEPAE